MDTKNSWGVLHLRFGCKTIARILARILAPTECCLVVAVAVEAMGGRVMWKTCGDFAKAGAEEYGRTALGEVQYRIFDYAGNVGEDFICTTHSATEVIVSSVMFTLPLCLVEMLIPSSLAPTCVRRMYYWRARLMIATLITMATIVTVMVTMKATSAWICSSATVTITKFHHI